MQANFENLAIKRIIIHEVPKDLGSTGLYPPRYSSSLTNLNSNALDALSIRLVEVLGSNSQSIELEAEKVSSGSTFQLCALLPRSIGDDFVQRSRDLTLALAQAQTNSRIPGGIVFFVTGTVSASNLPFTIIIKAELVDGFSAASRDGEVILEFFDRLALTPQQKFYKAALIMENQPPDPDDDLVDPQNYSIYVYDHNIVASRTGVAALYFYKSFLGCKVASTAKRQTRNFFKATGKFIDSTSLSGEEKTRLHNCLHAYLTSNSSVVHAKTFADDYLTDDQKMPFYDLLTENEFPATAVLKDLEMLENKLRTRRIKFDSRVTVTGPADRFETLVQVETTSDGTTIIRIAGSITEQT